MSYESSEKNVSANWFITNKDKIKFDLAIQRNEVWSEQQKSLLIRSLILGIPIPDLYAFEDTENNIHILEGKQRGTTLQHYLQEDFALSEDIQDINGVSIAEKKYSQLPQDIQDIVRAREHFRIIVFKDITEEEQSEMFLLLNGGVPLSKIELNRVAAGSEIMSFVQEIAQEPFFKEKISLSEKMINRFVNEEVILQIITLLVNESTGLSSNEIKESILKLKEIGISEELQKVIRNTTYYLNSAFPVQESFLKKLHIPMIFLLAITAQKQDIEPRKFSGLIQQFFSKSNKGHKYFNSVVGSTAKKDNVEKRKRFLQEYYDQNIDHTPQYTIPVPKTKKKEDNIVELKPNQATA